MPDTTRLQSVLKLMAAYPFSSTLPSSHGLGEERGRPYELPPSFEVQQVLSAALLPENPKEKLPPFTINPETIKKEKKRGKEVFREVYNNIPVMREPVSTLRMTLKALTQSMSWVPVV